MERYLDYYFLLGARLFDVGVTQGFDVPESGCPYGRLYMVRSGGLEVRAGTQSVRIDRPSLLLIPRPRTHRLIPDRGTGVDMVGAKLSFDGGANNMAVSALPDIVCLAMDEIDGAGPVLALLFEETTDQRCWRAALVERLLEVVMIQVLRQLVESGQFRRGLFAGLSHPRLRNALVAMHDEPGKPWTLDMLANVVGMSRSVFATVFRETVGATPGQYLQSWRIQLAQKAMRRGRPLKSIAIEVGYGSESALSRAFKSQTGKSPRQWKADSRRLRACSRPGEPDGNDRKAGAVVMRVPGPHDCTGVGLEGACTHMRPRARTTAT